MKKKYQKDEAGQACLFGASLFRRTSFSPCREPKAIHDDYDAKHIKRSYRPIAGPITLDELNHIRY